MIDEADHEVLAIVNHMREHFNGKPDSALIALGVLIGMIVARDRDNDLDETLGWLRNVADHSIHNGVLVDIQTH
jgi:hypothetical protein